jgi:tetratricopeptide (TPR) repeat protein
LDLCSRWCGQWNIGNIRAMPVFALTIFIGAFLLFQVQPLIGKYILPWFGGGPGVWTACLLFFQMVLLAGYAYAHFISRWFPPRRQAMLHLVLLGVALALLPIIPADAWKPEGVGNPTLQILALLAVCIGLPYFVLSATGPLMQHWFSRTHPGVSPYRLYALSNAGSLLALVSFPIYFETHFTRKTQATLWGWGLVLYAIGCAACALKLWRARSVEGRGPRVEGQGAKSEIRNPPVPTLDARPPAFDRILWLLLPACASVLLLATTNMMCQEVAVIPFLWVLPLALYLLSFIICFDNPRWYARLPFGLALMAAWGGIIWVLFKEAATSIHLALGIYSAGLFICCMVCHGELYRLRPDPRHLTGFYLMIAAGGALGGLFVAVIAPLIFNDYFELQWGLVFCGLLFLLILVREWNSGNPEQRRWRWGNVQHLRALGCAGLVAGLAAFGVELWLQAQPPGQVRIFRTRNFYGVLTILKVDDEGSNTHFLELLHGRTIHGLQFTDPAKAAWPTLYYNENSGVGLALQALPAGHRRSGVIGLGVGTLAAYSRAGDYLHVYEINPEVERIATSPFTCLARCQGKVEITLGDGRLSLEREPPQDFDLLALDAFNGDAIPVHLLTREAFAIYGRHLKTNGIIAMHVSNRSLNLEPVVANLARQFNYEAAVIEYHAPPARPWIMHSVWMLLSRSREIIDSPAIRLAARPPQTNSVNIPLWTDDFTSLFQILKSGGGPQNDSEFTETQTDIASRLCQQGDFAGAIAGYRRALQTLPRSPVLLNNLAFLLAICPDAKLRNPIEATRLAEAACQLTSYSDPPFVSTLAAVYSEAGRFPEAIATAEKACALAGELDEPDGLKRNRELLELYRARRPYHEAASPDQPKSSAGNPTSGDTEKHVPAVP